MRRAIFWTSLALLLPQALLLRWRAPRLPPPGGPTTGSTGRGLPMRLLAVGDSIAAGVGAPSLDDALVGRVAAELNERLGRAVSWQAIGRSGATSRRILDEIVTRLDADPADVVLLTLGVNDVTGLIRSSRFRLNVRRLIDELAAHSPGATIAVSGLPSLDAFPLLPAPLRSVFAVRGRHFDEIVREEAARHPCAVHVPITIEPTPETFATDGFHPSASGYRQLAADAAARVVEMLRGPRGRAPA